MRRVPLVRRCDMALVFAFLKSYWLYAVSVLVGAWLAWLVQEIRLDGVKVEFATYKAQVANKPSKRDRPR